ncbi:signal recognition particle-docking protein FtsY [Kutzneria viridogrisea]|uniref:Signal recognition particle receptor FtsY n=1 Tax=Kutzneria viridogrisea TaxID=47990 RepID=A0ABR6BG68_9PSEU|nr:fused signal recognition particle receptor [Kutzneria viridogrisea]
MLESTALIWIGVAVLLVLAVALVVGLVLARKRRISLTEREEQQRPKDGGYQAAKGFDLAAGGGTAVAPPPVEHPVAERTEVDGQPGVGDDASVPRDSERRTIVDVDLPERVEPPTTPVPAQPVEPPTTPVPAQPVPVEPPTTPVPAQPVPVEPPTTPVPAQPVEPEIEPTEGRLERLRGKLSRSQSTLGKGLLGLLGAGNLDEDSWTDIEDTLLMADIGAATTTEIVDKLRERLVSRGVRSAAEVRALLREVLIESLHPEMTRSVRALPNNGNPAVLLVVGVNGTGKTTTTGKLARVLVADGRTVLLGAADTFRAAAADQLATWAERVGAEVVRGKEGADPAAVAFDAVKRGVEAKVDAVLVDTAGRLHTKTGLMDELGKVKRVVEKQAEVDEVLLVLDATTGQNGLTQARVFGEVVDVTGIVLTKLDGTAKGGIVFQVQRELGVPVKLVGLGEGADDLAPFEPGAFVDALLG